MSDIQAKIVCLFLEETDFVRASLISEMIHRQFKDATPDEEIRSETYALLKKRVLIELDVEMDALDGALLDHSEHGQLDSGDITYFSLDDFVALGPNVFEFVDENVRTLRSLAESAGLTEALKRLTALRVDSSQWTGLPAGFRFTRETQTHVVRLLREAERQLDAAQLLNSESAQAKAYAKSALIIAEAPDPQPDLVWEIVQRGGALAGIGQFFLALIALFTGK